MQGGQSKVSFATVQRFDMPPLSRRKNVWKRFRHLLTPTWVTKKTIDTRAKHGQLFPPIPQPGSSRQLVNTPNDFQIIPSLISSSSGRPATPTSLYNLEELEELIEEFFPESNPVSNLDELPTSMPSSNFLEKDLPPNQLRQAKSGKTLVSLPPLQKVEASAHQNSTFQRPRNPTDSKDAGGAVLVERSSASTIPVLPKVPLPRPVKPSTINLRSQLPPIGSKAQQLTTRPVTACAVQPRTLEPPRKTKLAPLPKFTCTPVQLTGGKVEHSTPKDDSKATQTGKPTPRKVIRIPCNPTPRSVDFDEFHLLDRLDVHDSSVSEFSVMRGDWEMTGGDDDLLDMYREDLEKQEIEGELEELKKTHGHLSVPRLRRYLWKRKKQMQLRKEEEQVRKVKLFLRIILITPTIRYLIHASHKEE